MNGPIDGLLSTLRLTDTGARTTEDIFTGPSQWMPLGRVFGKPERPAFCAGLRPSPGMCGSTPEDALAYLADLEMQTDPWRLAAQPDGDRRS